MVGNTCSFGIRDCVCPGPSGERTVEPTRGSEIKCQKQGCFFFLNEDLDVESRTTDSKHWPLYSFSL